MKKPSESSIVICAAAKNIKTTFESDYKRISFALNQFARVRWMVIESDSTDGSAHFLSDLASTTPNLNILSLGNLSERGFSRTEILAKSRNKYLEIVFNDAQYSDVDYLAIVDLNGLNDLIDPAGVLSCFDINDWDFCTANQSGKYYDVWALRHPLWSPNDCWEQLDFYRRFNARPNLTLNAAVNVRMLRIPLSEPPISVDSAFGGFGILRVSKLTRNLHYVGLSPQGDQVCEHVAFCSQLKNFGGTIVINPKMINTDSTDHSQRTGFFRVLGRNLKYPIKAISNFLK